MCDCQRRAMQLRKSKTRGVAGNQVLRLIALLMVLSSPVFCQSGREQTSFGLEEPFRHPVKLPVAVVEQLRVDEDVRGACDTEVRHLDASWFEATTVRLKRGALPALLVRASGTGACLLGANIGPFWIFTHSEREYRLVLSTRALGMDVLASRAEGYRDLEFTIAIQAGRFVDSRIFKFRNGKYALVSGHTSEVSR